VLIALTYYAYDFLLTFSGEIELFWRRKLSGTTLLFLFNRYSTLLSMILSPFNSLPWSNQTVESCVPPYILTVIFTLLSYISIALFSALRAYAIGRQSRIAFVAVLLAGLVLPGTMLTIYIDSTVGMFGSPVYGCAADLRMSWSTYIKLTTVGRLGTVVADAIVVYLTWKETYSAGNRIMSVVLRDGTIYFSVMFILNFAEVLEVNLDVSFQPLQPFVDSLGPILVSHFFLNLRQVPLSDDVLDSQAQVSVIQFITCTVKDMGVQLSHGDWYHDSSDSAELHRVSAISDMSFMAGFAQDDDVELSHVRSHTSRPLGFDARQEPIDLAIAA